MGHSAADDFMDNIQRGRDSADEASALRAEIERLRAALEQIAMEQSARNATQAADYFQHVAREALRGHQQTPPIPQK